jgi:hypothetical protein
MLEETRGGGEGGSKLGFLDLDSPSELLQWGRWKFWNELACERKEGQLRIMNPPEGEIGSSGKCPCLKS